MKVNSLFLTIAIALVVGAAAFFGGMKYQQSKATSFSGRGGFRNMMGTAQNGNNIRPVRGEILKSDDKSITVKLSDGSSMLVLLTDSTMITEATAASKSALSIGKQVLVLGQSSSDGSVTAQNIQLNPQQGFGGGMRNQGQ